MEPMLSSLRAILRGALILGLSLSAFAQIPAAPDSSGFTIGRKTPDLPLTALPPAPRPVFEFRGIRIGDKGSEAERAITIGSKALDTKIAEQEHAYERH